MMDLIMAAICIIACSIPFSKGLSGSLMLHQSDGSLIGSREVRSCLPLLNA